MQEEKAFLEGQDYLVKKCKHCGSTDINETDGGNETLRQCNSCKCWLQPKPKSKKN